jgi:membrane-bound lytic murein transglycosylase A
MLLLALLLLTGSSRADWQHAFEKIPASQLPALTPDGSLKDFRLALARQTENCRESRSGHFHHCGNEGGGPAIECDEAALEKLTEISTSAKDWKQFYAAAKSAFDWYREKDSVLFTAYNSPLFPASLRRTKKFAFPLFSPPPGLEPKQYDRKAIEIDHALAGKGLEIAWLSSPANVLRLQIEGSGVLRISGKDMGINYAAKNGFPYVSIFKTLPAVKSFPALDVFAQQHPKEFLTALTKSPSYVFFTFAHEPPCGTARVHVTGGHSLAVDPTVVPYGSAAFLSAERPRESGNGTQPFTRFAFAQDSGGAIKGAHVDLYFGTGDYANVASNTLKARGQLFLLRSKGIPPK